MATTNPAIRDGIEKNVHKLKMTETRQTQALQDTKAQITALQEVLKTL